MGVNHVAPFVLTNSLLALLKATAAAHGEARVVTVASNVHLRAQIDLDDLNSERGYNTTAAYGMSKLANVLFSNALARHMAGTGVASNSLHPGVITTKLLMAGYNMTGASVDEGAKTSVHVATAPELRGITGRYFDNSRERAASPVANDVAVQDALWAATEKMLAGG
jgi:NAD(P)-dependent dehydrogenase (short-subunit alcohol dehydrogenase family)